MAEVIEFRVPVGNGRTLLVLGLEADASEHALYLAFSAFGPLYSMKVHRNAPVAGPGCYALVKFYSARDARRAQCACNKKPLFQKSPLKKVGTITMPSGEEFLFSWMDGYEDQFKMVQDEMTSLHQEPAAVTIES